MKRVLQLLLAALMLAAMTGCSKLTQENYEKLKMGMSYQEVVTLLGEPDQCDSTLGIKSCVWGEQPNLITVKFAGDTTIFFSSKGLS